MPKGQRDASERFCPKEVSLEPHSIRLTWHRTYGMHIRAALRICVTAAILALVAVDHTELRSFLRLADQRAVQGAAIERSFIAAESLSAGDVVSVDSDGLLRRGMGVRVVRDETVGLNVTTAPDLSSVFYREQFGNSTQWAGFQVSWTPCNITVLSQSAAKVALSRAITYCTEGSQASPTASNGYQQLQINVTVVPVPYPQAQIAVAQLYPLTGYLRISSLKREQSEASGFSWGDLLSVRVEPDCSLAGMRFHSWSGELVILLRGPPGSGAARLLHISIARAESVMDNVLFAVPFSSCDDILFSLMSVAESPMSLRILVVNGTRYNLDPWGGKALVGVTQNDAHEGDVAAVVVHGISTVHSQLVAGATYSMSMSSGALVRSSGGGLFHSNVIGRAVSSNELFVMLEATW